MSEQTDKASQKTRKAPATKRPPKKTRPAGKRSSTAERKTGAKKESPKARSPKTKSAGKALAPDPATITFGSNKPIVAAPAPPKPVTSGLRFAGPSDGVLKSSGPQPTSAKAEGLTFTNAKSDDNKAATGLDAKAPSSPQKASPDEKPSPAKTTSTAQTSSTGKAAEAEQNRGKKQLGKPENRKAKTETGKSKPETGKTTGIAKSAGPTKPAIAPQNHGPLIEKEASRGPFALVLGGLAIAAVGILWWLNTHNLQAPASDTSVIAASEAPPAASEPASEPPPSQQSMPAAAETGFATPNPAVSDPATPSLETGSSLSIAEIREVQDLLQVLGLDTGADDGALSEATKAAIRDYQTMAGLPIDGEASPALLEELRSVASLYGGN